MKNTITNSLLVLAIAGLTGSALAQAPGAYDPGHPRVNEVNQREQNQQNRIANGLENGTMNAKQAAKVENKEAKIQRQERQDMRANGGHLTKGEQRQLNKELNNTSRQIYRDKH